MSAATDALAIEVGRARRALERCPEGGLDEPRLQIALAEAQARLLTAQLVEETRLRHSAEALARALAKKLHVRRATSERLLDTIADLRRGARRRCQRPIHAGQLALPLTECAR